MISPASLKLILKSKRLSTAVDEIREQYGGDSIMCSCFLYSGLGHMMGGVIQENTMMSSIVIFVTNETSPLTSPVKSTSPHNIEYDHGLVDYITYFSPVNSPRLIGGY